MMLPAPYGEILLSPSKKLEGDRRILYVILCHCIINGILDNKMLYCVCDVKGRHNSAHVVHNVSLCSYWCDYSI